MDGRLTVYTFHYMGSTLYDTHIDNILETLRYEIESLGEGDEALDIQIGIKIMTESEFAALPEFEGF